MEPNFEWNIDMRTLFIFGPLTRYFTIAALGFGPLMGCSDTGTGPEESPQYFPLAQGNTWTYAPESSQFGDPFEWSVAGRVGDTVTLARPAGGSHPGPVTLLDHQEAIDLLPGEGEIIPFYRFEAGASWERRDPWECDDGASWAAVVEKDPITTPAGVFRNTIRVERRTTATCTDAGTTFEWWAPGVGLVQWEELNFYAGGPLRFYLTSYSVN
jgi:hypothetical protein